MGIAPRRLDRERLTMTVSLRILVGLALIALVIAPFSDSALATPCTVAAGCLTLMPPTPAQRSRAESSSAMADLPDPDTP
jgi:hypothetical protein